MLCLKGPAATEIYPSGHTLSLQDGRPSSVGRRRLLRADAAPVPAALGLGGVSVLLGGRAIVRDVDLNVAPGEIVGLIGSNGAGKTTLMNAISGFVPATGGIRLAGDDIRDLPPHLRARRGLGRSFQTALLYPRLTTRECVLVALESQHRTELVPSLLALPPAVRTEARARAAADEVLEMMGLQRYAESKVATLSTGTRRIVAPACTVAVRPAVQLPAHPTAGIPRPRCAPRPGPAPRPTRCSR